MASNKAIQFLRKQGSPSEAELADMLPGQPLYDMANNKLYLGRATGGGVLLTSTLEGNITSLQNSVTTLQGDVTSLKNADTDFNRRLTNLGFRQGSVIRSGATSNGRMTLVNSYVYRQGNYVIGIVAVRPNNGLTFGTEQIGTLSSSDFAPRYTINNTGSTATGSKGYVGVSVSGFSAPGYEQVLYVPTAAAISTSGIITVFFTDLVGLGNKTQLTGIPFCVVFGFEAAPIT